MNFFDILYARKNGDALSANFFDLLFEKATAFDVWEVYEGALPAQFSANGDDLKAYQIFGNTGGVGTLTPNAWDGVWLQGEFNPYTGEIESNPHYVSTNILSLRDFTRLSMKCFMYLEEGMYWDGYVAFYDANQELIEDYTIGNTVQEDSYVVFSFAKPSGSSYVQLALSFGEDTITPETAPPLLLVDSSVPPSQQEPYIPTGYEVDVEISDGTNTTLTHIYISTPALEKGEYIDSESGKVVRRTEQLFDKHKYVSTTTVTNCTVQETETGFKILATNNDPYTSQVVSNGYSGESMKNSMNPVKSETKYTISASSLPKCYVSFFNDSFVAVRGYVKISSNPFAFTTPQNCAYVLFRFGDGDLISGDELEFQNIILIEGSTVPSTYIPYLQPTAPPVPLPAIPTVDGSTIIEVDSVVQPEKVYFEYKKR